MMTREKDWTALETMASLIVNQQHLQDAGYYVWNYTGDDSDDTFKARCVDLHQSITDMQTKVATLFQHVPVINPPTAKSKS